MTEPMALEIYQCLVHDKFVTLCMDTGGGGGVRFFSGKCCNGQYGRRLKKVRLDNSTELEELIEVLNTALERLGT